MRSHEDFRIGTTTVQELVRRLAARFDFKLHFGFAMGTAMALHGNQRRPKPTGAASVLRNPLPLYRTVMIAKAIAGCMGLLLFAAIVIGALGPPQGRKCAGGICRHCLYRWRYLQRVWSSAPEIRC